MRRSVKNILFITASVAVLFASCKKDYHCQCTYNNRVMLNNDLGTQSHGDASTLCNSYDSTVTGEVWNCTLY